MRILKFPGRSDGGGGRPPAFLPRCLSSPRSFPPRETISFEKDRSRASFVGRQFNVIQGSLVPLSFPPLSRGLFVPVVVVVVALASAPRKIARGNTHEEIRARPSIASSFDANRSDTRAPIASSLLVGKIAASSITLSTILVILSFARQASRRRVHETRALRFIR